MHRGGPSQHICDKRLALTPERLSDRLRTLEMAYHKAPFFAEGYALAEKVLGLPEDNLALFLEHGIRQVCAYLGIETPIGRSSDLPGNDRFKREERIYDFCARLGADTYINAPGGQQLYSFEEFERRGIRLRFLPEGGKDPELSLNSKMFLKRIHLQRVARYEQEDGGEG